MLIHAAACIAVTRKLIWHTEHLCSDYYWRRFRISSEIIDQKSPCFYSPLPLPLYVYTVAHLYLIPEDSRLKSLFMPRQSETMGLPPVNIVMTTYLRIAPIIDPSRSSQVNPWYLSAWVYT